MLSYLALPLGLVRGLHALCVASKRGRKRRQDGGFRSPVSLNWNFPAKIGSGNWGRSHLSPCGPLLPRGVEFGLGGPREIAEPAVWPDPPDPELADYWGCSMLRMMVWLPVRVLGPATQSCTNPEFPVSAEHSRFSALFGAG